MMDLYPLMRPFAFALSPEKAHSLTLTALKTGVLRLSCGIKAEDMQLVKASFAGLDFVNPFGMAAGFDKDGEVVDPIFRLGFAATEIGTLTPQPQPGNPRPRLFRLVEDEAVINRMGFNNSGYDAAYQRLAKRKADLLTKQNANSSQQKTQELPQAGILGVNIGANKTSTDRIADYTLGLEKFYAIADYFTANISSPNTPGLRNLQNRESLRELLAALVAKSAELEQNYGFKRPIFLKIAPDLEETDLDDVATEFLNQPLDGMIVSNTTISRPVLKDTKQANETGGLSGCPLFEQATIVLAKMRQRLGIEIPIIGVGGVHDTQSALAKIQAGADFVQIYSGMVYQGPFMVSRMIKEMAEICRQKDLANIFALRDSEMTEWANKPISPKKS